LVSNSALVSGVVHFLINHSVSQKVILIAWYCTEICELFISVGSRFCAGCVNWITLYSVTYGDITEEPVAVDKQYPGGQVWAQGEGFAGRARGVLGYTVKFLGTSGVFPPGYCLSTATGSSVISP